MLKIFSKALLPLFSLAILVAVATGCGGDSEAAPLSKAAFTKQANAICAEEQQKAVKIAADLRPHRKSGFEALPPNLFLETLEKALIPSMESQIERIEGLGVPKGDKAEVQDILDSMQRMVDAASSADVQGFQKLGLQTDKMVRSYGLTDCSVAS